MRTEKRKQKTLEYASDSGKNKKEPLRKRSKSANKARKSTNKEMRQSTLQKNPVIQYEYDEYMAHHYAFMVKVAVMSEPWI